MKIKNIFVSVSLLIIGNCFLTLVSLAQSPDWSWAKSSGGTDYDYAKSIVTDSDGNVIVAGSFENLPVTFGSIILNNQGSSDMFIVKYNANGDVLWAKSAGGPNTDEATSVTTDASGNIIVTGSFKNDSIIFGSIILTDANPGNPDIFIVKYDPYGNELWAKSANNSDKTSVTTDPSGNVVLTGIFSDFTITFDSVTLTNYSPPNMFIVKYDTSGNVNWARLGEGVDKESFVSSDMNGNVYAAGYFRKPFAAFGQDTLTIDSYQNLFIIKYDANGNVLWTQKADAGNTINVQTVTAVANDTDNNVYLTGYFQGPFLIFGSDSVHNSGSFAESFIVKYDNNGSVLWTKLISGNNTGEIYAKSLAVDGMNNLFITGSFGSLTAELDSITLSNVNYNSNGVSMDLFLAKYDSVGNALWAKSVGGNYSDNAVAVAVDPAGDIYIAGNYESDSLIFGSNTIINAGGNWIDLFIAGYNESSSFVWPGDANRDSVVNNNDLLPIGLYYSQTGAARESISNLWQPYPSADWDSLQVNGFDIKNADCNGDGIIDDNDTLAVNLNFNLAHAITPINSQYKQLGDSLYIVTSGNIYNAGDWINAEIWLGTAANPVDNLYGIAFNIDYNASLVQQGTENIMYSSNWLGNPGTNAIKISKIDPLANRAYGTIVKTDHANSNGYGKIADFRFQIKSSVPTADSIQLAISYYNAVDALGAPKTFTAAIPPALPVAAGTVGIKEQVGINKINVYPNPSNGKFIFNQLEKENIIEIYDIAGRQVYRTVSKNTVQVIDLIEKDKGVYFYKVIDSDKKIQQGKIILK